MIDPKSDFCDHLHNHLLSREKEELLDLDLVSVSINPVRCYLIASDICDLKLKYEYASHEELMCSLDKVCCEQNDAQQKPAK